MPNLDFYAADDDRIAVLDAVFDLGLFRVFEAYSEPDRGLREFHAPEAVPDGPSGRHLELYALGSGPRAHGPAHDLHPGALGAATFRYSCEGWGLIQLHFEGVVGEQELRWSHTNHNTEKRASKWAGASPELGDPALWNWAAVTSASGMLNRVIRRMAVSKIGSHPVLPQAGQLIAQADLQYEYGIGIHATPSFGMSRGQSAH
jgi:hypothetical protein